MLTNQLHDQLSLESTLYIGPTIGNFVHPKKQKDPNIFDENRNYTEKS